MQGEVLETRAVVTPGISARGLSVIVDQGKCQKTLLSGIDLEIPSGQFVAIIGASGCGKSTLVKALAGIRPVTQGKVLLAGHSVERLKQEFPLAVGYLPQFGAFHQALTVEENLRYAQALRLPRSVPTPVRKQWSEHITSLARLNPLLAQTYDTLSGGQMRRLALAEELIGDPAFLFMDELTSGLDEFSDQEMMIWLRDLAHEFSKTVVLVTHSTYHLHYCDAVVFLHAGRLIYHGSYASLLEIHGASSVAELFSLYQSPDHSAQLSPIEQPMEEEVPHPLKTAKPPSGFWQFSTLLARQGQLFVREKSQLWLHLVLIVTFPLLVAVFATKGLPQVRSLTLQLETNVLRTMEEQLLYMKESFHAASLISGLAMFQVVLLTLLGANNGAREIAKERAVLQKERRAGLSSIAYVGTKFGQILLLCLAQAFWMTWFVKTICGFPGDAIAQFGILFLTTMAMSSTCLAISAACASPERASLLAIYLVGFQLPLSGAALSLPDWLSTICRPFIVAYWGWSGYLKTFVDYRNYDIVRQSTHTFISPYGWSALVLGIHVLLTLVLACWFVRRTPLD